ncbi:uncharacterized protein BDV17DRAFT_290880 [Aspergillus undulatus]|uniref:uncharacterized protein n=1 Tax=Aspergillus undulatus TaxID=1810928 RepID=UPI003CCD184A
MSANANSNTTSTNNSDDLPAKDIRFGFECLRNIRDGKVDLAGVMQALNYTNIKSVANRFNALKKQYDFSGLESTSVNAPANATPSKRKAAATETDGAAPAKRGPGRPPKKARGKAAKAVKSEPADNTDDNDGEREDTGPDFQAKVEVSNEEV